jgi:phospholipid/cholesterol/gamma-HCH transport system substrate-binding protein
MDMEFSRIERLVGIFIIGVFMLLLATLVIIGRGKDWFETYISYYTTFNESYNLQENAAVKLFKADIGIVKNITLEKNRVRVKLAIQERYASRIRQDAVAVVESPTLIGSEYISIIPGSAQSPLIPELGEIPSREKRSLTDILSEFQVEKTGLLVVKTIQDISVLVEKLAQPNGPLLSTLENIQKTSSHVEKIASDLKAGKGPMGTILKSDDLLKQILLNIDRLGSILQNIQVATAKAPDTMAMVRDNLAVYGDAGRIVVSRVEQAGKIIEEIRAAAADLKIILKNVKAGSSEVPRISNSFKDGVDEIRQGVEEINRVVDALQENIFIRSNLPPEPMPATTDADARP